MVISGFTELPNWPSVQKVTAREFFFFKNGVFNQKTDDRRARLVLLLEVH
jgi:hypothetical protein